MKHFEPGLQHLLAFGRQPGKHAATAHDRYAELLLQRAQRIRQCGLGDVAGFGSPRKMAMRIERSQIAHGRQKVHQVLLLTVMVGNLLEKSLACCAILTAILRATWR